MARRANRRDANHRDIIEEFKRLGWSVLDIADLKNCCDLMVAKCGHTIAIEVKDGEKPPSARKLTSGEESFRERWTGNYKIVINELDVQNIDNLFK